MRTAPILFLFGAVLVNCASLTPYPAGTCGNRVVDVGEDCDDASNAQCVSCRLRCESDAQKCPSGWGCGTDKICRQMTGRLEEATAAVSSNVFTLKAGDFDGDGRVDVLGSPTFGSGGGSSVHYFDRNAVLATTTSLDLSIAIPIVKDLDGDKVDDLGFSARGLAAGAFGALAGQRDRSFSTIVFPSVTIPDADTRIAVISASATNRLPGDLPACAVGVGTSQDGLSVMRNICQSTLTQETGELKVPIDFKASDVIGLPLVGRLFPEGSPNDSACGQIVFRTSSALHIVSPCTPRGADGKVSWRTDLSRVVVDLTGRELEDIYLGQVSEVGRDELHAAARVNFFVFDGVGLTKTERFTKTTGLPLASADLDGDGHVDFVFPGEIRLSRRDPLAPIDPSDAGADAGPLDTYRSVRARDQLRWSAARIGRFNNDDLPDVLVAFTDSLDVDVLGNAGGGRFTAFTVRSEQTVRAITSGDFDGDRIDDVAFFQSASPLGTADAEVTLTLAFGSAVGGPEAPRTAGKFKNARAVSVLRGAEGTDNLAVLQQSATAAPTTSISVLFGNSGRQQIAPLFMFESSGRTWQPSSFSIGSFLAPNSPTVVSIATGVRLRPIERPPGLEPYDFLTATWTARADPTAIGGFAPFELNLQLDSIIGLDQDALRLGARQLRVITAVGDVDSPPDQTDELVNMAVLAGEDAVGVLVVRNGLPEPNSPKIPRGRVAEGDPIELIDVDRDGYVDLVYVIRVGDKRYLSVLRGRKDEGQGRFDPTPLTTESTGISGDAQGFAKLDTGTATKLAVVTRSELWLVELDAAKGLVATNASSALGASTTGISAITSGDFNGDGVPDLAIAQGGGVRIIRQAPTTE